MVSARLLATKETFTASMSLLWFVMIAMKLCTTVLIAFLVMVLNAGFCLAVKEYPYPDNMPANHPYLRPRTTTTVKDGKNRQSCFKITD